MNEEQLKRLFWGSNNGRGKRAIKIQFNFHDLDLRYIAAAFQNYKEQQNSGYMWNV